MATWYDRQVQEARLSSEKATLKALQDVYTQAAKDCAEKIIQLELRIEQGEHIQSAVYQAQYQRAVLGQLETALESLQDGAYDTISEYLQECYTDNYVGTMYSLQQQGIPIITPIDQNQAVQAVEVDSLLAKGLYSALGENVENLKTAVAAEVSRGVASGKSWSQVAKNLTGSFQVTEFGKAYRLAIRIARTEGHRVQNQAQLDAMTTAKDKGADVVKQWDASLDSRTRPEHQALDGQIKEIEDYFEVGIYRGKMPGGFHTPEMDINCRCCMLQRAAWALDEEELETLKARAEFFGLDKAESFEEFREKYLTVTQNESIMQMVTAGSMLTNAVGQSVTPVKHTEVTGVPNSITQVVTAKGGISRNYYDSNGRQVKQISNGNHGNPKQHPFGENGEHAHDYSWDENGSVIRGRARPLTPDEMKENGDIL